MIMHFMSRKSRGRLCRRLCDEGWLLLLLTVTATMTFNYMLISITVFRSNRPYHHHQTIQALSSLHHLRRELAIHHYHKKNSREHYGVQPQNIHVQQSTLYYLVATCMRLHANAHRDGAIDNPTSLYPIQLLCARLVATDLQVPDMGSPEIQAWVWPPIHKSDYEFDFSCMNLNELVVDAAIKYMAIYHHDSFIIGVFLLQKGATIPIHDHRGMSVVRCCIKTSVLLRHRDVILVSCWRDEPVSHRTTGWIAPPRSSLQPRQTKLVCMHWVLPLRWPHMHVDGDGGKGGALRAGAAPRAQSAQHWGVGAMCHAGCDITPLRRDQPLRVLLRHSMWVFDTINTHVHINIIIQQILNRPMDKSGSKWTAHTPRTLRHTMWPSTGPSWPGLCSNYATIN